MPVRRAFIWCKNQQRLENILFFNSSSFSLQSGLIKHSLLAPFKVVLRIRQWPTAPSTLRRRRKATSPCLTSSLRSCQPTPQSALPTSTLVINRSCWHTAKRYLKLHKYELRLQPFLTGVSCGEPPTRPLLKRGERLPADPYLCVSLLWQTTVPLKPHDGGCVTILPIDHGGFKDISCSTASSTPMYNIPKGSMVILASAFAPVRYRPRRLRR